LGIVGSQVETKWIFSLARILINIRRCLQIEILEKMIFVSKNWPTNLRIGCECPFNLVEFLERDIYLEKELEKLEGDFERDEVVEV
jgi:hypothetical protein